MIALNTSFNHTTDHQTRLIRAHQAGISAFNVYGNDPDAITRHAAYYSDNTAVQHAFLSGFQAARDKAAAPQ